MVFNSVIILYLRKSRKKLVSRHRVGIVISMTTEQIPSADEDRILQIKAAEKAE